MSFWEIIGASAGQTGGREEPGSGSSMLASVLAAAQQASGYAHAGREHSGNQPVRPENAAGGDAAGRPEQATVSSQAAGGDASTRRVIPSDAAGGDPAEIYPNSSDAAGGEPAETRTTPSDAAGAGPAEIRPNSSDAAGGDTDRLPQAAGGAAANPPAAAGSASASLASVLESIRDSGGGGNAGGGFGDGGGGFRPRDNSAGGGARSESFLASAGRATVALGAVAASGLAANAGFSALTNRTLRVNAALAAFSAEIATAVAEAEAAGMRRSIRQGQVIGPAYRRLSEAQNEYRDMVTDIMSPLQSAGLNATAALSEIRNSILGTVAPAIQGMTEGIDKLVQLVTGANNNNNPQLHAAQAFLADISDGKMDGFGTTYGQPGNRPLMNQPTRDAIFGPPPGRKPRRRPAP